MEKVRLMRQDHSSLRSRPGLVFLLLVACSPAAEPKRILHPPHKIMLDRLPPAPSESLAEGPMAPMLRMGLPKSCKADTSQDRFCIQCTFEPIVVVRCYNHLEDFNPQTDCRHTTEHVKCLNKALPSAFLFAWHPSREKLLRSNFLMWRETIAKIWDDTRLADDKPEIERIVKGLDWLSLLLSSKATISARDGRQWVEIVGLGVNLGPAAQDFIVAMQKSRLEGKLTLSLLLEGFTAFYLQTHGPSPLWEELRTMSLEGLDE